MKRVLHFTQYANTEKEIKEIIEKLDSALAALEGVTFKHYDGAIYNLHDDLEQRTVDYYVTKQNRKTTWNDIYKVVNKIHPVKYFLEPIYIVLN